MADNLPPGLGATLAAALDDKGITQAEIGEVLGLSQAAVSRRMTGVVDFRTGEIEALLSAFAIPAQALLPVARAS